MSMKEEISDSKSSRIRAATPPHVIRPWPLPVVNSQAVENIRNRLEGCNQDDQRVVEKNILREYGSMPLWEHDCTGWSRVTFLWVGEAPNGVVLQLNRFSDPIDIADTRLPRLGNSRVHALTLQVPDAWLGSYCYLVLPDEPTVRLHEGVDRQQLRRMIPYLQEDPLALEHMPSKLTLAAPSSELRMAVARAPQAPRLSLWHDPRVNVRSLPPVTIDGVATPLSMWSHPEATLGDPVVLLTDGEVWRGQFPIATELQRQVSTGQSPPLHLVFLDSGGPQQRQADYTSQPAQSRKILEQIRNSTDEVVGSGPWVLAGQSLGGLFAVLCATRHPDLVSAAIAQSPSLWWPAGAPHESGSGWFQERAILGGVPVLLEGGYYDWVLIDRLRDAAALLQAQNALIGYEELSAGHDILQWQATLPQLICRTLNYLDRKEATWM